MFLWGPDTIFFIYFHLGVVIFLSSGNYFVLFVWGVGVYVMWWCERKVVVVDVGCGYLLGVYFVFV